MAELQILSDLALQGALVLSKNEAGFPTNPRIGTMIIKDQCLYAYITVGNLETWYPFASRTNSYTHTQGLPATTWTVTHNLGTSNIWLQILDNNGNIVSAGKTDVSNNVFTLHFTEAIVGTVLVVAPDSIDVPQMKANVITVGDNVQIDSTGVRIGNEYALTTAVISNEINTAVTNAVAGLVDSAPTALDTLNELAAALGDDANFAGTVTNSLATKVDKINITAGSVGSSTAIPTIHYNAQGQITSVTTNPIVSGDGLLTVQGTNGLTGSGTFSANQTTASTISLSHADTSNQASVTNTGGSVVQSISLDGNGHITSIGSKTLGYADVGAAAGTHSHADYATVTYVDGVVNAMLGSTNAALDTIEEIAVALGDDPNFAATINASLAAETARATTAEAGNATAIAAEATRATAAEGVLTSDLAAEVTRATAAEGVNAAAITAETTRATAAETANANAIAAITPAGIGAATSGHDHSVATTSANGFMSSTDKSKLDGVATGANNYSHPSTDGNLHVPANGTTNNGKVLKAGATAGSLSWGTLTAADVGAAASSHTHDYAASSHTHDYAASSHSHSSMSASGKWSVDLNADVLYFKFNGVNKASLDSSGNLTVTGNVTAWGTV